MDKVRENITQFITSMNDKYQFKGLSIVEFGCGLLDYNKKLFSANNKFIATDCYQTPFSDEILDITDTFQCTERFGHGNLDFLIVSEVLEHVYKHYDALDVCSRLLKQGGYLLITIPWEYPEHGEDYWRYSERTIDLLLQEHGFEVIERMQGFDNDKKTNIFRLARKL